ncbi:MAG: tRNA (adenosine(37)-N6)-threonylcarbamoyltransferase complex ATPase subunit type 1 TsaE [Mobilicoccus sp.]|nr:tRNA (adenosine(37)-N6)-threonylcarbamoyltransferase complex ATPase subunit type 1 TsaE [Mobilicoccus sp.]
MSTDGDLLLERVLPTADDTTALGRALAAHLRAGDVLVLVGELGAGKTTFTQGLGDGLGVRGPITSPTFVLSRVHPSLVGGPDLVHVDAYRLAGAGEVDDIDLDDTVATSVTVIEWGAGVAEQLSDSWLTVELLRATGGDASTGEDVAADEDPDDPRTVRLTGHGPRWRGAQLHLPSEA